MLGQYLPGPRKGERAHERGGQDSSPQRKGGEGWVSGVCFVGDGQYKANAY